MTYLKIVSVLRITEVRIIKFRTESKVDSRAYTAFEAWNQLFQFTRLAFGITNGVSFFQREMTKFV